LWTLTISADAIWAVSRSPWQVDAAYKIEDYLLSNDKQFVVLNCPPGAGKSTLFHDIAVWQIVKNRKIRVMIGSVSQSLAKMYSRRIRETLERQFPLDPDPVLIDKGLAIKRKRVWLLITVGLSLQLQGRCGELRNSLLNRRTWVGWITRNQLFLLTVLSLNSLVIVPIFVCLMTLHHRRTLKSLRQETNSLRDGIQWLRHESIQAVCSPSSDKDLDLWTSTLIVSQKSPTKISRMTMTDQIQRTFLNRTEPLKKQKYHHLIYKAYYEELDTGIASKRNSSPAWPNGPLLDPHRLSWKDLSYIKHSNPSKFAVVYQQEDQAEGNYLIERVWATGGIGPDGVLYPGCVDNDRRPGNIPSNLQPPLISIASVDPSPTMFWAIQWWIYQPETNLRFLIDVERVKLTAEQLLGYDTTTRDYSGIMEDWQNRAMDMGYPISHWVVEVNAAQRFLLAHDFVRKWQSRHNVNVIAHTTSRNKIDENLGVEALLPQLFRSGAIRTPSMRENWKTLAFIEEHSSWTRDKKNGTDLVMACWMAMLHLPNLSPVQRPQKKWRPSWLV
jgi:hypothetical protein